MIKRKQQEKLAREGHHTIGNCDPRQTKSVYADRVLYKSKIGFELKAISKLLESNQYLTIISQCFKWEISQEVRSYVLFEYINKLKTGKSFKAYQFVLKIFEGIGLDDLDPLEKYTYNKSRDALSEIEGRNHLTD